MSEVSRIKDIYAKRLSSGQHKRYSLFNASSLYESQLRERAILAGLRDVGINDISDMHILDIGCGTGSMLRDFIRYGATPNYLHGIDLLPERIEIARKLSPNIEFICTDASTLPYNNESFSIVMQCVVFTSILDGEMKRRMAREMIRVLKPDGMILWIDFHMNNPRNPDVRGIKKGEINHLFDGCRIDLRSINLAPPLIRAIIPYSWLACYLLERIKVLNTHYLGIIRKER